MFCRKINKIRIQAEEGSQKRCLSQRKKIRILLGEEKGIEGIIFRILLVIEDPILFYYPYTYGAPLLYLRHLEFDS